MYTKYMLYLKTNTEHIDKNNNNLLVVTDETSVITNSI